MSSELGKVWVGVVVAYLRRYLGIPMEGLRENTKTPQ